MDTAGDIQMKLKAAFQSQSALVAMMHWSGLYTEHIGKDCVDQLR